MTDFGAGCVHYGYVPLSHLGNIVMRTETTTTCNYIERCLWYLNWKNVHKVCKCASLSRGTYSDPWLACGAINYVEKNLYEINCSWKNTLYVVPLAGRQWSIGGNATSDPSYAELHPPAAVIFITHYAAGHRYLGSVIFAF